MTLRSEVAAAIERHEAENLLASNDSVAQVTISTILAHFSRPEQVERLAVALIEHMVPDEEERPKGVDATSKFREASLADREAWFGLVRALMREMAQ